MDVFYIADWLVDTNGDYILRNEIKIKLESRVMAVLLYLAQHPDKIISRTELETAVWADTVVGYDALTSSITKLRKALGDNARQPVFIETVAKKGYRLIAPISISHSSNQLHAEDVEIPNKPIVKRVIPVFAVLFLFLVVALSFSIDPFDKDKSIDTNLPISNSKVIKPSIAVLPFTDLSHNPEKSYFSDGITADVTTALSKLSGLLVIAWSSSASYKNQETSINQVSSALGVRYVLEGKVRRENNKIRVNVQLVDAKSGQHIWAERYDRSIRDILEVQSDIAEKIVNALSIKLTEEEKRLIARRYTSSVAAYDDFLKGQSHERASQEETLIARDLFQMAIDRDPDFARAYGALALSYVDEFRFRWGVHSKDTLNKALALSKKAISIDENLPQAYWVLGYVHLHRMEYKEAIEAIKKASLLDPNNADNYGLLALISVYQNEPETAIKLIRRAKVLNPHYSAHYPSVLGQAYYSLGQYDKALPALREAIDRNVNLLPPHIYLVSTLSQMGHIEEAQWEAEQIRLIAPKFTIDDISDMFPFTDQTRQQVIMDQLHALGY